MPEDLRAERDKWDADHNGLIDLNEYKTYFQARMQQRMAERGAAGFGGDPGLLPPAEAAPVEEEDRKPVVYHTGKLPKELPAWFEQLDTDKDAQIGLYEWKASGRSLKEFQEMDRNNDGFLTVEEVLAYEANKKKGGSSGTAIASAGPPGGAPTAPTGFAAGPPGGAPPAPTGFNGSSGRSGRRRSREGR